MSWRRGPFVVVILGLCGVVAGCSTLFETAYQKILIRTPGAQDAECELTSGGAKVMAYPPQKVQVSRVYDELTVACFAPGGRQKTLVVTPRASPVVLMNVANGIVPGLGLDHESGAMYRLPDVIDVDFRGVPTVPERHPSYENPDAPPPLTRGLDSEKPGFPGLDRDNPWSVLPQKINREADAPSASEDSRTPKTPGSSGMRTYAPGAVVGPGRNEEK